MGRAAPFVDGTYYLRALGPASGLLGVELDPLATQGIGMRDEGYRGYSKLRTHTALGSYGRAIPTSIGPP